MTGPVPAICTTEGAEPKLQWPMSSHCVRLVDTKFGIMIMLKITIMIIIVRLGVEADIRNLSLSTQALHMDRAMMKRNAISNIDL